MCDFITIHLAQSRILLEYIGILISTGKSLVYITILISPIMYYNYYLY